MKTYPKIETLFDRDPKTFKVIEGKFRREEFSLIDRWIVTEKVDGTNIRIDRRESERGLPAVGGKTDKAQIPPDLLVVGNEIAESEGLAKIMADYDLDSITLYGEGYGPKIQSGGDYRDDQGFILFDVFVNDHAWLDDKQVTEVAERLEIPRVPLIVGGALFSINEIVRWAQVEPASQCSDRTRPAEGIVARPPVPLYDRRGERVMFKLKAKDFA